MHERSGSKDGPPKGLSYNFEVVSNEPYSTDFLLYNVLSKWDNTVALVPTGSEVSYLGRPMEVGSSLVFTTNSKRADELMGLSAKMHRTQLGRLMMAVTDPFLSPDRLREFNERAKVDDFSDPEEMLSGSFVKQAVLTGFKRMIEIKHDDTRQRKVDMGFSVKAIDEFTDEKEEEVKRAISDLEAEGVTPLTPTQAEVYVKGVVAKFLDQ